MTPDEGRFFELLDAYAGTRHRCFVVEMSFWTEERGYYVRFRPVDISENSDPYAREYLWVPAEQVRAPGREELPPSLVDQLDAELPELKKQT